MKQNHSTKTAKSPQAGAGEHAQRTTSEVEQLAKKLADCKRWKKAHEHRPSQSGWYPVVVCVMADRERQWPAVGRYLWPHDEWRYLSGELPIDESGPCVTHWMDTPLPPLPQLMPLEGV